MARVLGHRVLERLDDRPVEEAVDRRDHLQVVLEHPVALKSFDHACQCTRWS